MSERMPGTGKERVDKDPKESVGKFAIPLAARLATAESPPGKVLSMEEPNIDKKVRDGKEQKEHTGSVTPATDTDDSTSSDGTNSTGSDTQNSSNSTGSDNQIPDGDIEEPKRPVFPKPPKGESLVAPPGEINDLSLPPLSKPKDYNQMLGDMKKDQLVNVSNPVKQDDLKDRYASSEPSQRNQVTEDVAENAKP
jgi:hypothetical protein